MITQEMKDNGLSCRGKGFGCAGCRDKHDCVDSTVMRLQPKPPIGLPPKRIWQLQRLQGLKEAIVRYSTNGMEIPSEWIIEYNELLKVVVCNATN